MPTVLITGANRGIGLEFARQFKSLGYKVLGTSRKTMPSDVANVFDFTLELEVDALASIAQLPVQLKKLDIEKIDFLILNAGLGIFQREPFDTTSLETLQDQMIKQFTTNAMGPVLVTRALIDYLDSSKVAILTSLMGSISDNTSGAYYGYRMSKSAVNMATKSLAFDLATKNSHVIAVHPGMVATDMTGGRGIPASESVSSMLHKVILPLDASLNGKFVSREGKVEGY